MFIAKLALPVLAASLFLAPAAQADQLYKLCVVSDSAATCPPGIDAKIQLEQFNTQFSATPDAILGAEFCTYMIDGFAKVLPYSIFKISDGPEGPQRVTVVGIHCITRAYN